jgi:hypothetical protein
MVIYTDEKNRCLLVIKQQKNDRRLRASRERHTPPHRFNANVDPAEICEVTIEEEK